MAAERWEERQVIVCGVGRGDMGKRGREGGGEKRGKEGKEGGDKKGRKKEGERKGQRWQEGLRKWERGKGIK